MQTFVSDWETHLPNRSNLHEATDVCCVFPLSHWPGGVVAGTRLQCGDACVVAVVNEAWVYCCFSRMIVVYVLRVLVVVIVIIVIISSS